MSIEVDAARYRWLREHVKHDYSDFDTFFSMPNLSWSDSYKQDGIYFETPESLDRAIDTAMTKERK